MNFIQNIYYMLAYAFQVLNEEGYRRVATEEFEYVSDLLTAILAMGISSQIKRGLSREYIFTYRPYELVSANRKNHGWGLTFSR